MASEERVPLANPASDLLFIRREVLAAAQKVIDSGIYILGSVVEEFEREMAARLVVPATVGVASGTDALVLALLAVGVGVGDEVITVSHTAGPTVAAIKMIGAVPVLVDVEADSYCLDPANLGAAHGPRTRAVLTVHLYGHPARMAEIVEFGAKYGVPIVEDCAQAQEATCDGRQVGAIGELGCFSFYPTKNLGAIGDGGLVSVRAPDTADLLRQLRTYGWTRPQFATIPHGRCSRLDPLQAAILMVKLKHLACQIDRRRAIAQLYWEAFSDLPLVLPSERVGCRHAFHLFVVRTNRREDLASHLDRRGIATGLHYAHPVHEQPALSEGARIPNRLRVTEEIVPEILTLPLFPSMTEEQQERVVSGVRSFFGKS